MALLLSDGELGTDGTLAPPAPAAATAAAAAAAAATADVKCTSECPFAPYPANWLANAGNPPGTKPWVGTGPCRGDFFESGAMMFSMVKGCFTGGYG